MPHLSALNLEAAEPMDVDSPVSADSVSNPLTKRVDSIYMLSLLIAGSHRMAAQEKLSGLKLAPKLNDLFDELVWRKQDHGHAAGHISRCNCSPEVILKIQFLRLVHNYCYHSSHKLTLLSNPEWQEICMLSEQFDPEEFGEGVTKPDYSSLEQSSLCGEGHGLLSKIIGVLRDEPVESVFRFWLCRAIESWLRGSCTPADQLFVIRRGLLQHITKVIVEGENSSENNRGCEDTSDSNGLPREVAQSSFDLLGEIIRFSQAGCIELDSRLDANFKVRCFFSVINSNLVDSNMFLRSVFLSLDHFMASPKTNEFQRATFRSSKFFGPLLDIRRRVAYLASLISTVSVDTLTQENISCLNTVIILLMLAQRRDELPECLEALSDPTYPTFRRSTRDSCSEPDPALVPHSLSATSSFGTQLSITITQVLEGSLQTW
uniref:Trpc4apa protein n=1 Tax=Artemia sinica TaxID=112780 RepID=L7WF84_9CRUS|nr:trpc4apa protein [Artemia sinica]